MDNLRKLLPEFRPERRVPIVGQEASVFGQRSCGKAHASVEMLGADFFVMFQEEAAAFEGENKLADSGFVGVHGCVR